MFVSWFVAAYPGHRSRHKDPMRHTGIELRSPGSTECRLSAWHVQDPRSRGLVQVIRCRRSEEKALMRFEKTRRVFQDQKQAQDISGTGFMDVVCNVLDGQVERDGKT
jgi:hypothetical protein